MQDIQKGCFCSMKIVRMISLILLAAIALSACASDDIIKDGAKDTTAASETTAGEYKPSDIESLYREQADKLPELDFGGDTIRFLTLKNRKTVTGNVYEDEIWVEELKSEPLNDTIYNRNMYVCERFNCKIENTLAKAEDLSTEIEKHFSADDDVYQVIGFEAAESLTKSFDGFFHDLNSLDTDYIEFDAPWWSSQFFDAVVADDKVYALAGSLSLSMIRSIHATFFNKDIAEEERIEDLYTVVEEGRWTVDYQTELVSGMYRDLNGDSERDIDDRFGYAVPFGWATDSYWSAFNIDILSRDDEGRFEFVLNEEKAYNGFNKIMDLSYGTGSVGNLEGNDVEDMFTSGNVFMITHMLAYAEDPYFRNMQSDYGIIPMPKYDENQKEYYSMPYEIFQTYMVPKTARDPGKSTAILEALCAETWRKVIPVYSELVLKGKYLSDPQSRKMFDMIITNTKIDAGLMYYRKIGEIGAGLYRYPVSDNKREEFATVLEKKKRMMKMYLKDLNGSLFDE